jgi:acyl dehydratase
MLGAEGTAMTTITSLSQADSLVGQELGVGDWVTIGQERIDAFAAATDDRQWLHTDAERAAAGPYGTTVAHGFLVLALLPALAASAFAADGFSSVVNYGLERVRFPAPVPSGGRVRDRVSLVAARADKGGLLLTVDHVVELEGASKPACVARQLRLLLA